MRIGIDARFFGPQETGIGRYVERLISHLGRIDDRNEYVVFLRQAAYAAWQPPNPRWRKVLADFHWYTISEQRFLPAIFRRARLDLLHVPHFNVPVFYRGPWVVTIHDLILDEFPTERATTLEPLIFWAKFQAYRLVVRQAITRAARILTVSEHSLRELLRRFGLRTERVTVTYEGVDPLPPPVPFDQLAARGIRSPYLLHVGNAYPHKNLERLLLAWQQALQPHAQLVFVGKRDYFVQRLEEFTRQHRIPNVLFFGFASEAELAGLYRQAQAYVFPSLSEGFGLPGLEAMQAGTPVYAARASCLPEVFGQAAEYFNPLDLADMAVSIQRALHDTLGRQRLIAAGKERLTRFSWSAMARQTLSVYASVIQPSRLSQSERSRPADDPG